MYYNLQVYLTEEEAERKYSEVFRKYLEIPNREREIQPVSTINRGRFTT